jgi:Uncharacterized protein conserved in bacteria (DUF2272)
MRATVCVLVAAIGLAAHPAFAQTARTAAAFWTSVQANCDATAGKPAGALGPRIAQTAIAEFDSFGGHKIDANGRLFHFGLTEAENGPENGRGRKEATLGRLGWWQVLKYWRALYGDDIDKITDQLEVRAYRGASTSDDAAQTAARLAIDFGPLLRAANSVSDSDMREALRDAVIRSALIDTSWSAAFISYVIKQAGVAGDAFQFANAHRVYIYDAVATSAAELAHAADAHIYRACPLATTKPRPGDLICDQREPALADASDAAVRERIRTELAGSAGARTVRHTHCEVVAHVDASAHKIYTIGGNVLNGVAARKLNLRRGLTVSPVQKGRCGGAGHWTPPGTAADMPQSQGKCSLNDQKWFVLLQLR